MHFIESDKLDKKKWNELVNLYHGHCFFYSYYLDAVAKKWGVYVDETYSKGAAVVYNEVFTKKILYPASFTRSNAVFNLDKKEIERLIHALQKDFQIGTFYTENRMSLPSETIRKYQIIDQNVRHNTLAKRMIKRALKEGYILSSVDFEQLLPIFRSELKGKFRELNPQNLNRLTKLLLTLKKYNNLSCIGIFDTKNFLLGGMAFTHTEERTFYIIGAAKDICKKNGGMYFCMNEAIQKSILQKKIMDFGGSNIENIRRFYTGFGGKDQFYYAYQWNHAPFWFNCLRILKKKLKN